MLYLFTMAMLSAYMSAGRDSCVRNCRTVAGTRECLIELRVDAAVILTAIAERTQ